MGELSMPCGREDYRSSILPVLEKLGPTSREVLFAVAPAEVEMWLSKGMLVGARLLETSIVDNVRMNLRRSYWLDSLAQVY
jgi:hypothetical protein